MRNRALRYAALAMTLLWLGTVAVPARAEVQGKKKRVAVFDFEDKSGHKHRWWNGQPVGTGMSDMLVTALVKSGKYSVIEREKMTQILKEQGLGMSGVVTPQSAAQVGKMLGVELAIFGSVTEFGYSKSDVGGRFKGVGLGVQSSKATTAVDVRFVNTTTGEIVTAESVRKDKSKKGLRVRTRDISFKDRHQFDQSLVGKATRECIDDIVKMTDKATKNLKWEGKVVKASGMNVIINSGAEAGVKVGDRFKVLRPGEELIDPDTGLALGSEETAVGEIEVTDNSLGKGKASRCRVVSGSGFQRGDLVRER